MGEVGDMGRGGTWVRDGEKRGEEGTWGRWVRDEGHRGEKIVVGA